MIVNSPFYDNKGNLIEYREIEVSEVETEPTQLDIIEAQVAYTAMMTNTLLEV